MKTLKTLLIAMSLLGLVAAPTLAHSALAHPAVLNDGMDKDAKDEWNIEADEYWRTSIDENDERAVGYVAAVDYPTFTLRTHDEGVMAFVIPETTEYADDLRTGQRVQVWYEDNDMLTDDAGESWMVVHGFGIHADDRTMTADTKKKSKMEKEYSSKSKIEREKHDSVAHTRMPTSSKAGPGPMAYTLTGEITQVNDNSVMLETPMGIRVVRLVDATQNAADLEVGNQIEVDFHKGGEFIHAKVIRNAESR